MVSSSFARSGALGFLISGLGPVCLSAQQLPEALPLIVVTATRGPLDITRAGSSINVIDAAEIEKLGPNGVIEALRSAPGLEIHENGGIGSTANATLRGSNPGQTLVLIDGIRVGDPTGTDGSVDLGAIAVADVERIEVLRGPQSALYGSDAMGGVINIITRKGDSGIRRSASIEGGSYGTLRARASISGATDNLTYAFSVDALHTDGFARYVNRTAVRAGMWPPVPNSDPTNRVGVSGRISYRVGDGFVVDAGLTAHFNRLTFDNPFAFVPSNIYDRYNESTQWTGSAFTSVSFDALDGRLHNKVTFFASSVDRAVAETESCSDFFSNCVTNYRGRRYGAEYQGDLKVGPFGLLTFGARTETETAVTSQDTPFGYIGPAFQGASARQTTNSVFALQQFTPIENMDISIGGRIDAVSGGQTFPTWRATWAWRIPETGTKFRASAGTGAKNPSLFQRFSQYGDPNLSPERSVGVDAGIDQSFADGRVNFSATVFANKYRDLIDFRFLGCPPAQPSGCYFNVGRASTWGVETSADWIVMPGAWRVRTSYTYLVAKNELTGEKLLQRPRHKGSLSLVWSATPKLEIEMRATIVGSKIDFGFPSVKIAPYAKFDIFADYKISDALSLFARVENIADTRYEEVSNYRVAGRSFFAGVKATW